MNEIFTSYEEFRSKSDKSIPEAVEIISGHLAKHIQISSFYDDTEQCTDLIFKQNELRIAHRARTYNPKFEFNDVSIKMESAYGPHIKVEYHKLLEIDIKPETLFWYFYCQFCYQEKKIKRYILYDVEKLSKYEGFRTGRILKKVYNTQDKGSSFGLIKFSDLEKIDCIIELKK